MHVTLESLCWYLNGRGCLEERVLREPGGEGVFIEFACRMKSGKSCRAVLAAERWSSAVPARVLAGLGKRLAPCLGRGWQTRIPPEGPFA
jgi:hypothetical protein